MSNFIKMSTAAFRAAMLDAFSQGYSRGLFYVDGDSIASQKEKFQNEVVEPTIILFEEKGQEIRTLQDLKGDMGKYGDLPY